jgi:DNA-damage-inducible protein J
MKTAVLQVRLDGKLKKQAESVFNKMGLDIPSATRLFYKQTVLKRRLPFFVTAEEEDPFYSEANQRAIKEAITRLEAGKGAFHELIEA